MRLKEQPFCSAHMTQPRSWAGLLWGRRDGLACIRANVLEACFQLWGEHDEMHKRTGGEEETAPYALSFSLSPSVESIGKQHWEEKLVAFPVGHG